MRIGRALVRHRSADQPVAAGGSNVPPAAKSAVPALSTRTTLPSVAVAHGVLAAIGNGSLRAGLSLRRLSFILIVMMPVTIAAEYYLFVAADQYVAEFRFALSTAETPRFDALSLLAGNGVQTPVALESQILVQYMGSRAIVEETDPALDLRRLFAPPQADWWARLPQGASIEALVRYWKGQVDPFYDPANGTITVRARAFAPEDALRLSQAIITACEKLVNELSARARNDALRQAEADLSQAETRLKSVLGQIREMRDREGMIDPTKTAEATGALATRLRDELLRANTELTTLRSYMRDDAPSIKVLKARIRSLEGQRRSLAGELTARDQARPDALSHVLGSYEQLESERKFAETAYQLALHRADEARTNADRQHVFVASFVPPSLPQEALYPRRWRSLGTLALLAFAIWAIGGLTVQSVRDHLA